MSTTNRLDLVILGATGFTGKRVVGELARIGKNYPDIKWAVAGRNRNKLESVLQDISEKTGDDLSKIEIIIADVEDKISIKDVCCRATVVVNCCGPFVQYGEVVVSAAIDCKTHYVDVSGETQFIELLEKKYDQPAREAGIYIINACGLSSIPADFGVSFLEQNFGGTLNSVESYLITHFPPRIMVEGRRNGIIRYSSWVAIINSMAYISMKKIRQRPSFKTEPELKQRWLLHKNLNKWCLPFPGADSFVVHRTQRHLLATDNKRPVQYKPYITFPSIFSAIGTIIGCMLLFILSKMPCTRRLLLKHPKFCSFGLVTYGDPKEGMMDGFCFQYEMLGRGWDEGTDVRTTPDKRLVARVSVSGVDPAYVGTAVAVIFSAITIIKEKEKLPPTSGVMTAGVAFRKTSILKKLQENNIKFEIIKK
ncbi:saccharopine dehydrogenase-like oxidoreductase [Vanessa tameamea]|uniref:Saccharopine dehydrogenase-like oxidoreductase n=1 Tax=Vanessa tameamea TaxID=334116 RepID=A0A8B8IML6_VANTA